MSDLEKVGAMPGDLSHGCALHLDHGKSNKTGTMNLKSAGKRGGKGEAKC